MKAVKNNKNWFANWFNSTYYHLLYQHRDHTEAEKFIRNLLEHLQAKRDQTKVLDLACGKGRHAIQLNEMGYRVLGLDLSKRSIQHAKQFENEKLQFVTGDMRDIQLSEKYDIVLNLFTSFGYFQEETDNQKVIDSVSNSLKKGGHLVLDYLNTHQVENNLPQEQTIEREGVQFHINKFIEGDFIIKDIRFNADGNEHHFQEFVRRIDLEQFKSYFTNCGLELVDLFGDYHLNNFDQSQSERLILIAEKTGT